MLDQAAAAAEARQSVDTRRYDLIVIGAGISGLNALFVAAEYLRPGARTMLVDRRERAGGMWTDTYPFVRLHQPHPSFTVGDLPWDWAKPSHYLATGAEVRDHLAACLDRIRETLSVDLRFGQDCLGVAEVAAPAGPHAEVTLRDGSGTVRVVRAARVIDAAGLDIPQPGPLPLSSDQVLSATPQTVDARSDAPAYIVGGGKTGMDTALTLIRGNPGRPVTLINGRGTVFASRDLTLPNGVARYWRGHLVLPTFRRLAMRFDGTNAADAFAWFRQTYTISPDGRGEQFLFGLLSEAENSAIARGVQDIIGDYLQDVVDGPGGPRIALRSGRQLDILPGSVIVNCSGHVLRHDRPYVPYLSPGGTIVTITSRSAVHFLSSVAGYFLPHLFLSDMLADAPLYELDLNGLMPIDRQLLHLTAVTHTFHNTIVLMDTLPFSVLDRCGLDLDRWFPLHRRLAAFLDVKLNRRRYLDHCRAVLDRVQAETGVRCGPLTAS